MCEIRETQTEGRTCKCNRYLGKVQAGAVGSLLLHCVTIFTAAVQQWPNTQRIAPVHRSLRGTY